jgi:hypothetical protein
MAEIVMGVWTTHGPQLNTTPEEWMLRVPSDKGRRHWFKGKQYSFDELVELRASENLAEKATLAERTRNHAACQAAIGALAERWAQVNPDVCIIFGNDQRELMLAPCQPAYTIFYGDSFWNGPMPEERSARLPPGIRESEWANRPTEKTIYPAIPELANRLIERGLDERWDFTTSNAWPEHPIEHHHSGTPHAFAYILRRVMNDAAIPTLPIITNTFFPPNQPRPWRCFELGKLVYEVVQEWKTDLRVAIVGSGGMSHFVINEGFDKDLIGAIQNRDEAALRAIEPAMMNDGTSELLNWVSAAGCMFNTSLAGDLIDYVPCYRTEAGSGTAQGFLVWS